MLFSPGSKLEACSRRWGREKGLGESWVRQSPERKSPKGRHSCSPLPPPCAVLPNLCCSSGTRGPREKPQNTTRIQRPEIVLCWVSVNKNIMEWGKFVFVKVTICILVSLPIANLEKADPNLFLRALNPLEFALRLITQKMKPIKLRRSRRDMGR